MVEKCCNNTVKTDWSQFHLLNQYYIHEHIYIYIYKSIKIPNQSRALQNIYILIKNKILDKGARPET